jgi:hypothetical protein
LRGFGDEQRPVHCGADQESRSLRA